MSDQLYYADEIADQLRRSRVYVYAMKAAGFQMPGGTATLAEARDWLRAHPDFSTTNYIKKTGVSATAIPPLDVAFD